MVTLVDAKKSKEVRRHFARGSAAFSLPEEGVKIVSFAQDGPLSDIEALAHGLKMKKGAR